ncbi:MAG: SCO family protein [Ferruginibacter sp.]
MTRNRSIWIFILAVVTVPVIAFAIVSWYQEKYARLLVYGPDKHELLDFNLVNQHAKNVSLKSWQNKIIIADFFFTSCPSVCPKMTASLKKVLEHFPVDNGIEVNSFSIDPERDNVDKLSVYAAKSRITERWNFLTGDKIEIYRLARKSLLVVATDGDGGVNDFIHSEKLILIDTKKRIRGFYDGTDPGDVELLINDIRKLKEENN